MGLIRVLLAFCVVAVHSGFQREFPVGTFAVQMFFIISGFYMALVLNSKYPPGRTDAFYIARYMRLYPAYIVTLVATLLFVEPLGNVPGSDSMAFWLTLLSAFSMIGLEVTHWFGIAQSGNVELLKDAAGGYHSLASIYHMEHMWSVGVEITAYLLSPFILRSRNRTIYALLLSVGIYLTLTTILKNTSPILNRSAVGALWLFFLGASAFFVYAKARPYLDRSVPDGIFMRVICFLAAVALILAFRYVRMEFSDWVRTATVGMAIMFAGLTIVAFHTSRTSLTDREIGNLSYTIYVVHLPIVVFILPDWHANVLYLPFILGVVGASAVLLYLLIERPIDRMRSKLVLEGTSQSSLDLVTKRALSKHRIT